MNLANCHMLCYASDCPHPKRCSTDEANGRGHLGTSEAAHVHTYLHRIGYLECPCGQTLGRVSRDD